VPLSSKGASAGSVGFSPWRLALSRARRRRLIVRNDLTNRCVPSTLRLPTNVKGYEVRRKSAPPTRISPTGGAGCSGDLASGRVEAVVPGNVDLALAGDELRQSARRDRQLLHHPGDPAVLACCAGVEELQAYPRATVGRSLPRKRSHDRTASQVTAFGA
jgi:hypothetical protein